MAQQWFRRVNGQAVGPLSSKALKDLASQGAIQPDEPIFSDDNKIWVPAGKIQGLVFVASTGQPIVGENPAIASPDGQGQIAFPPELPDGLEITSPHADSSPPLERFWDSVPSNPAPLTSTSSSHTAVPAQKPRPPGLNAALVLGGILLIGGACTATYFMTRGPETPVVDERFKELDKELHAERERLREEIDGLKNEVQKLEKTQNGLQEDTRTLEERKEKLQEEIDKLTTKLEVLQRWKGVDLVLMNAKQQAVGLKKRGISASGTEFVVFDTQEGDMAETVLAASRNLHIPRTSDDAPLAKDVCRMVMSGDVKPGEVLPPELTARINQSVWKTHSFVSVRPDTSVSKIDLAVFRDLVTNEVRMGYLHEATPEGIRIEAQGTSRDLIPWKQIQAGSARHGTPDEILPMLGNVDFLEYSLLRIAQKVGTGDVATLRPRVIVHCDIEISEDHIRHYQEVDRQLAEQGSTPIYYSGSSEAAPLFQFLSEMNRAMIPSRRLALRQEMLQTDPNRRERHLAQYVEGEVERRLSQGWGISTVSDKDLAKFDSGTTKIGKAVRAAALHDATHLLMITVKEPRDSGDYHLSVKLFDETGKDSWVNEGERDLSPEARLERFHASSGELTVLTRKDKVPMISRDSPKDALEKATLLMAAESPLIAPYIGTRSPGEMRSELVYLESSDEVRTRFRTIFDPQIKEIATSTVEKQVPIKSPLKDVSQDLILRYVVARIAEQMLPPAGRVENVKGLTGVVVGLTKSQGIVPGERCRVVRHVEGARSVLPTEAEVSFEGDSSRVTFQESGFEKLWPENVLLQAGDLLVPRQALPHSVRVEGLTIVPPDKSVDGRLKLNTIGGNRKKYEEYVIAASRKFLMKLSDSLDKSGIPTSAPDFGMRSFSTTHKVYGTITLSPVMSSTNYNPSSSPVFRITIMLSAVNSNQDPMQVTFDVTKFLD